MLTLKIGIKPTPLQCLSGHSGAVANITCQCKRIDITLLYIYIYIRHGGQLHEACGNVGNLSLVPHPHMSCK